MFEGELLVMFCLTFFLQIFSQLCFCVQDIIKINRRLLVVVSINGLTHSHSERLQKVSSATFILLKIT